MQGKSCAEVVNISFWNHTMYLCMKRYKHYGYLCLFNDAISSSHYVALIDKIREYWMTQNVEGAGHGAISDTNPESVEGTTTNHETPVSKIYVTFSIYPYRHHKPRVQNSKKPRAFPSYCCYPTCSCQQYKTVECCHGNAVMGSLCTAVELYKRT
jgi:hypothetical protein